MLVSPLKGNDSNRVVAVRDEGRILRINSATFDDWPGVVPGVVTQAIVRWFRSASSSSSSSESASSASVAAVSDPALNTASPTVPPVLASTSQDAAVSEKADLNLDACGAPSKSTESVTSETGSQQDDQKDQKKKKNRCRICRKKVGLTGFQCRCGGLFCSLHRYSNEHDCTFDYKEMGAQEIRKNNPVVVGDKIQKI
ncbi:hypothetical protein HPB52_011144 [Rhipicephalus sanguineus]|uniref:AN1-type domain-containing protein n=1 Tax=Rhipicephalus sanguineus TaxID=34632 RepID=A0A9D4PR89_RHISA|nr:hypothetical protein HPB52_011144 [Rhipicephalus sanguineus]